MATRNLHQEESWNSVHRSEASGEVSNDDLAYLGGSSVEDEENPDDDSGQSALASPSLPTIGDVRRVLHPLQATADRVGKQVEEFAESLDRLTEKLLRKQTKGPKDCRHVLPFIHAYQKTASDTVKHLQVLHAPDTRLRNSKSKIKLSARNRSERSTSRHSFTTKRNTTDEPLSNASDLRRWEQEKQTWDLLASMIQVEYPVPESERSSVDYTGPVRPRKSTELQDHLSEKEIWQKFLATDDLAWERHTVIDWLKRTADQLRPDIHHVIERSESDADGGSGLVAHSWLYTREAIKGQKRLRSWPRAFEPDDPGLDNSLTNAAKTESLITQLDPDAMTRQGRALEQQDLSFERTIWLACWEMLRRGKSWNYIKDWCAERGEHWRSAVIYGDLQSALDTPQSVDWQSQHLWRKTCAVAAKEGGVDEFERAVYGILSGYLPSVQQVCRSWSDQLFAHYNSYLIHSFDRYIKNNFATRLGPQTASKDSPFNFSAFAGQRAFSGNQLVEKLKLSDATREEATEPFKMLQGSLIARNFDDFVFKHGVRLCQAANAPERSKALPPLSGSSIEGSITAPISMGDYDLLRVVTHIIFIYQMMGHDYGEDRRLFAAESFIVAYVDFLSKAGKQQLLPLYASRLSHDRSVACLGRQLPLIRADKEREILMKLMKRIKLDIPGVLQSQIRMIIQDSPPDHVHLTEYPSLAILEPVKNSAEQIPAVAPDFIGDIISNDHVDLIYGFEWYKFLDGQWHHTMALGVMVYKYLLRCRGLAAGIFMSQQVPFSEISISKTPAILGTAIDIAQNLDSDGEADGPTSPARKGQTPSRRGHQRYQGGSGDTVNRIERDILLKQATSFRDLENLFVALNAINEWVDSADKVQQTSRHTTGSEFRSLLRPFKDAFKAVEIAMQPLLRGWLRNPRNEEEASDFKQIRLACLPELVLAYNSILNYSSYFAGRDIFKTSMDLADLVAEEDSELAQCFVETGRMPELVDSFAVVAKSMILAEFKRPGQKHKDGKNLGLWCPKVAPIANAS